MLSTDVHLLEGEKEDIREELKAIFQDADEWIDKWLDEPHPQLGGKKPKEFIGSADQEKPLRDLLRSIKHGMFT